jgi:hypothetical protein
MLKKKKEELNAPCFLCKPSRPTVWRLFSKKKEDEKTPRVSNFFLAPQTKHNSAALSMFSFFSGVYVVQREKRH